MDGTPPPTGFQELPLVDQESVAINLKQDAPAIYEDDSSVGTSHAKPATQQAESSGTWSFFRFIRGAFEVVLRRAIWKDGAKSQDQKQFDWTPLSYPGSRNGHEPEMLSESIQVLFQEWERLQTKRLDLMGQRASVREARRNLREMRAEMKSHDAGFERALRQVFANDRKYGLKEIEDPYENLQESRESLRVKEEDYDVLEDGLLVAEFEMRQLEDQVLRNLQSGAASPTGNDKEDLCNLNGGAVEAVRDPSNALGMDTSMPAPEMQEVASKPQLKATSRKARLQKQLRNMRRSIARLDKEFIDLQEDTRTEVEISNEVLGATRQLLRDVSDQRSDLTIQIMLLEEDEARLEDFIFHQQNHFFETDMFIDSANTVLCFYDDSLAISDPQPDDLNSDLNFDLPGSVSHYSPASDLYTESSKSTAPAFELSDVSKVSYSINSWLLQVLRASRFSTLLLHLEIDRHHPGLDTLTQQQISEQLWFSDGAQLLYTSGRLAGVQSAEPSSAAYLSETDKELWHSRVVSSRMGFISGGNTIAPPRSPPSSSSKPPGSVRQARILNVRSLSYTTENLEQTSYIHEYLQTQSPMWTTTHLLTSALDTRALATHYLRQLSSSLPLPWSPVL